MIDLICITNELKVGVGPYTNLFVPLQESRILVCKDLALLGPLMVKVYQGLQVRRSQWGYGVLILQ